MFQLKRFAAHIDGCVLFKFSLMFNSKVKTSPLVVVLLKCLIQLTIFYLFIQKYLYLFLNFKLPFQDD